MLQQIEDLKSSHLRLEQKIDTLREDISIKFAGLSTDVAMLKVKASLAGGLTGALLGALFGAWAARAVK